ncbi:MAG: DNA cytosine methyltransferase [Blastocatellia bacterium]|nr:DNA cytosine methyltransferase [Blastocatellia bacterium]
MFKFYEFFAGGGMARAGLGPNWSCVFSNDFDHKKSAVYRANWGDEVLKTGDVKKLNASDLPGIADLVWASFPCQDLSLAGGGAGLRGERSGTFWPFWDLMKSLMAEGRAPKIIVLENVCGALTSHGGKDFAAICARFEEANYQYGAMIIDAALFVPQSRPRLFIIGIREDEPIPEGLESAWPRAPWYTRTLQAAVENLPEKSQEAWRWWNPPAPSRRTVSLSDVIEDEPTGVAWRTDEETRALLAMMSDINITKVKAAQKMGRRMVGTIYKRTRLDENGVKTQRAEVRFDDIAGCLRTPAGGSSRQLILIVEGEKIRSRLISSRETARLMGLPDSYKLPENYNEAYHLTGDGVVVPVVRHLAAHLFEPILRNHPVLQFAAA